MATDLRQHMNTVVFLVFSSLLLAAEVPRVRIKVVSAVVSEGGSAYVYCFVPRHAENRQIGLGIEPIRTSWQEIHGEVGPVMFSLLVEVITCSGDGPDIEGVEAFCQLEPGHHRVRQLVLIKGCQ